MNVVRAKSTKSVKYIHKAVKHPRTQKPSIEWTQTKTTYFHKKVFKGSKLLIPQVDHINIYRTITAFLPMEQFSRTPCLYPIPPPFYRMVSCMYIHGRQTVAMSNLSFQLSAQNKPRQNDGQLPEGIKQLPVSFAISGWVSFKWVSLVGS